MVNSAPRCQVSRCYGQVYARGYCKAHYARVWRSGATELRRPIMAWARKYSRCIKCGTDAIPHVGRGLCKDCKQAEYTAGNRTKERRRSLRRYGLSSVDYDAMWDAQDGRCRICLRRPEGKLRLKGNQMHHSLHIDHDHVSNKVRGLLCESCNRGLGFFFDDLDLLLAA